MNPPSRPFLLGLTGGMGCGKSAAASILARHGLPCVDADREGHELLDRPDLSKRLVEAFGPGILACDGRIARKRLASVAFSDASRHGLLEQLLHPAILEACLARAAQLAVGGAGVVGLEAALLLESGFHKAVDAVLVVDCPLDLALSRLEAQRGFSPEESLARMRHQLPAARKRALADLVVENLGSLEDLEEALERGLRSLAALTALQAHPRAPAFLAAVLEAWHGRP